MASPLTSAAFADVINPVIREVSQQGYDKGKSRIPDFFTVKTSDRATEIYSEITPMGTFSNFTSTGVVEYDGPDQGYDVTATHIEYTKGLQIQRRLYDDDQHGVISEMAELLGIGAFKTHENHAAGLFNNAFSSTNDFFSHTEGVALCSDSHTCPRAGVSTTTGFDNLILTALSPADLTTAITQFRQLKDDSGDIMDLSPTDLVVPVALRDRADEIVKTATGLDSAEGTVNVHEGRLTVTDWYRMTDANNWFLLNREETKRQLLWFWRIAFETSKMESFDNYIAKFRAYMRYSWLRRNWRFILGANVT